MNNSFHGSEDKAVHGSLFGEYINPLIKDARERQDELLVQRFLGQKLDIADLGCGDGYHATLLAKSGGLYHGFEFAPEMASMARDLFVREGLVNATLFEVDLAQYSPEKESYDLVLCLYFTPGNFRDRLEQLDEYTDEYLDHNPVFINIISKFCRALKPDGRMFLCVYKDTPETEEAQWDFYLKTNQNPITPKGTRFVMTREGFWSARWTRESMLSNLKDCGIDEDKVTFNDLNEIAWLVEIDR